MEGNKSKNPLKKFANVLRRGKEENNAREDSGNTPAEPKNDHLIDDFSVDTAIAEDDFSQESTDNSVYLDYSEFKEKNYSTEAYNALMANGGPSGRRSPLDDSTTSSPLLGEDVSLEEDISLASSSSSSLPKGSTLPQGSTNEILSADSSDVEPVISAKEETVTPTTPPAAEEEISYDKKDFLHTDYLPSGFRERYNEYMIRRDEIKRAEALEERAPDRTIFTSGSENLDTFADEDIDKYLDNRPWRKDVVDMKIKGADDGISNASVDGLSDAAVSDKVAMAEYEALEMRANVRRREQETPPLQAVKAKIQDWRNEERQLIDEKNQRLETDSSEIPNNQERQRNEDSLASDSRSVRSEGSWEERRDEEIRKSRLEGRDLGRF